MIEVRSKNDSLKYIQHKIDDYLKAGVEIVWVADPASKIVDVYTLKHQPTVLNESDNLTLPRLIPDFVLAVADIFRD